MEWNEQSRKYFPKRDKPAKMVKFDETTETDKKAESPKKSEKTDKSSDGTSK